MAGDGRAPRDLVFFSYSHRDKVWLDRLLIFLKPYVRQGRLSVWADPHIRVGDKWRRDIDVALDRTLIAVLLVSPEFLASDFIDEEELPPLLQAADNGAVTLVPVPVSASPFEITPLNDYQWVRDPATPLDKLSKANRNAALVEIVKHIDGLAALAPEMLSVEAAAPPGPAKTRPVAELRVSDRLGDLYGVPAQRPHFLPRSEDLDRLKQALFASTQQTVGITGATAGKEGRLVGLHGMGGIGKTVMAIALAHDEDVRRAFPDGVLWITLGQQPDPLRLQAELAAHFTGAAPAFASITQGQEALRRLFADKGCLLVVDDLWQAADLEPFDVLGPRSRLLTTTRDAGLLTALGARELVLEVLSRPLAMELLAAWSEKPREALPDAAAEVAESCGDLPLALSLAGARVRDGSSWEDVLAALRRGDLEFLDHPYGSVFKSLRMSIDALPEDMARRYGELTVFPEDTEVPISVVCRLWRHTGGLDDDESRRLLRDLERKGLLYLSTDGGDESLSFHDLQQDFLRLIAEDLPALHNDLVDAYRSSLASDVFPRAWSTLPIEEPYIWYHLAHHMADADLQGELRALLLDYDWIAAKLKATKVPALIADYAFVGDDEALRHVQGALRLSAHVLAKDPDQLAGQLTGRLRGIESPELDGLVRGASQDSGHSWLRPETPSLTPPGGPLQRILLGHTAGVTAVAVASDGRRALSGSRDNTLRLWDLETGESRRTLEGHTDLVIAVAMVSDGRRAISGSGDNTLRLWDLETGESLRTLEGHTGWVTAVALLKDGSRALSGSEDGTLRLWDLETGESLRTLVGHTREVRAIAVLADGRRAVSGSDDNTLRLWDLETGDNLCTLEGHKYWVNTVAVSVDGRRAISGSTDRTLRLWDLEKGVCLRTLEGHTYEVGAVAMLADGRRAVSASTDRTLRLWDLETGKCLCTLHGHEGPVTSVVVLAKGCRAVSGSEDGTLRLWELDTTESLCSLGRNSYGVNALAVLADERRILYGLEDGTLRLWDLDTGKSLHTLEAHTTGVSAVAIKGDGRCVLSSSDGGTVRLWDLETGKCMRSLLGHADWVGAIAVLVDGRRVLSGSGDRTLRLWDLETGKSLRTLEGHTEPVRAVAVLADGHRAVSGSYDGTLRLWDLETGESLRTLEGHTDRVNAVAVLSDGRRAVSGSDDGMLRLWDLETGESLRTLERHSAGVNAVAVLADGRRAVSGSFDRTLRLWDLENCKTIATFTGDAAITSAAVAGDDLFVAGAANGALHILRLIE